MNTVTFGMFSGQKQGAGGGEGTDAEDVANKAGDAAQQTVDSAKVTRRCSSSAWRLERWILTACLSRDALEANRQWTGSAIGTVVRRLLRVTTETNHNRACVPWVAGGSVAQNRTYAI